MGRGEREARLESDIFVAEVAISEAAGSGGSADDPESATAC